MEIPKAIKWVHLILNVNLSRRLISWRWKPGGQRATCPGGECGVLASPPAHLGPALGASVHSPPAPPAAGAAWGLRAFCSHLTVAGTGPVDSFDLLNLGS